MNVSEIAQEHFDRHLKQSHYPGRGLVVGRSLAEDAWLIVYWLMGRSAHSRNRRLVAEGSVLRTEPVDPALVQDPSLIIYEAMLELPKLYLVSNGDQTRTLYETLQAGGTFEQAMAKREREPDAPNYTPRISAMLDLRQAPGALTLGILKANSMNAELTDRYTYRPAPPAPGFGLGLTTYMGDGRPLPSFQGDPLLLPCEGRAQEVLEAYWSALDAENRVAMAVKRVPARGGPAEILIRNRFGD